MLGRIGSRISRLAAFALVRSLRKTALVSANIGNIRGATVLAAQFSSHGRGVNFVNFGHSDTARALRLR